MTTKTLIAPQSVFPKIKAATNMPFFDGTTLAFCQSSGMSTVSIRTTGTIWDRVRQNKVLAEKLKNLPREQQITYRPWKLAYCNWSDKIIKPIATGLPANRIERSPVFYREGERTHLSFISGIPTSIGFVYRLYTCSGPDLDHLESPKPLFQEPLFFGFVSPYHICTGTGNRIQIAEKATGNIFQLQTSFLRIASVNFLSNDPAKLLITGLVDKQYNSCPVIYDLATGSVSEVVTGMPMYKSSVSGNRIIFAQKKDGVFEDRELHEGEYSLISSAIEVIKK